ncbi:MAG: hypothetical protein JNM00_13260 [Flavobacteriales bacterium]|nr:hypothetical protein [Flavobacteriales bacterium]
MKKILTTLLILLAVQLTYAQSNHGREDKRQKAQRARIRDGVKDGDITRGEQMALNAQQRKVKRMEVKFQRDGIITPAEKLKLERAQDRANRNIARKKNN